MACRAAGEGPAPASAAGRTGGALDSPRRGGPNEALYTARGRACALGTIVKILIGVAIGIVAIIAILVALFMAAVDVFVDIGEMEADRMAVADMLSAYPEAVEFKSLYPDYMEDTISVLPPHYQYELRSIDEEGSVFETDSLIIEYNSDTDESKITYLCTEPDGDRIAYDRGDLAEVMASVCG